MTHPAHPDMQSSLGTPDPNSPQKTSAVFPIGGNANPTGNPLGQLTPQPTQDMRQVREQIQFKDMSPPEQAQMSEQQGLDPYAPLKMVQQGTIAALGAGASQGPTPNMLAGPYVPPGIEGFPDDFAHLSTLMKQGYAPGATPQEHEFGQNANAMARAKIDQAMSQSQNGVGAENAQPFAPPQPAGPAAPPANVGFAPGTLPQGSPDAGPGPAGSPPGAGPPPGAPPMSGPPPPGPGGVPAPQLGSAMQSPMPPPTGGSPPMPGAPPGPGGIPPTLIAALLAQHRGKRAGAMR